ncbi:MAG TPA: SpoIID/LytB domain-containing protein, partial [Candidatus Ozemobacteraceae bacterium]|nr:SpoIID/LytB domain-containing protein [Candidatus Ozemobacteraceae bacterium]
LAVILFASLAHPVEAATPWKRQMRIGLYHLGVPRQFQVTSADGPLEVYDPFSRTVLLAGPASSATVICLNGHMQVSMPMHGSVAAPYPLVFSSLGRRKPALHISTPPYRGETYRGSLAVAPWRDRLFAVNLVDLEEYLRSVVPAEIGGKAPTSALEAQAVAARSYALRNHRRHAPNGFDLCDEVHCQVYRGLRTESVPSGQAVQRTAGWVLTHGAYLANTVYHANCGGHLASSQDVWKGAPVPYLTGHPDRIGSHGFFCAPEEQKSAPDSKSPAAKPGKTAPAAASSHTRNPTEKAVRLSTAMTGHLARHPSRGHRVGLCQDGAIGMAKAGYNGAAILNFYYPGTNLCVISSNLQLAQMTTTPSAPSAPPAAPRFGSGETRSTTAVRRATPARHQPTERIARTPAASSEPNAFSLNLRKWFWTALSPHASPSDTKIASAPLPKADRKKISGEPKKKILLSSAIRTPKGGGRSSSKSTRRNARR